MRPIALLFVIIALQSCFLFNDFRKTKISLDGHSLKTFVPKKFTKVPVQTDSLGNVVQWFHYRDGSVLYFALLKDTSTQLQPFAYANHIPKQLYHTIFYKQLDSTGHFSRETRFGDYRAGYNGVHEENEGIFDSSINFFSLHMKN